MRIEIDKNDIVAIEGDTKVRDGVLLSFYLEYGKVVIEMNNDTLEQLEDAIKKARQII